MEVGTASRVTSRRNHAVHLAYLPITAVFYSSTAFLKPYLSPTSATSYSNHFLFSRSHGYANNHHTLTVFFSFSTLHSVSSDVIFLLLSFLIFVLFSNELHGSGKVKIGINGKSSPFFDLSSGASDQFNYFSTFSISLFFLMYLFCVLLGCD